MHLETIVIIMLCIMFILATIVNVHNSNKIKHLEYENEQIKKVNLELKLSLTIMSNDIDDLKAIQQYFSVENPKLNSAYKEVVRKNEELKIRIEELEKENKKISGKLKCYEMIAPGLKFKSSFYGTIKKEK